MTSTTENRLRPAEVIEKYGACLELAPMDKHFHDISVGLYVKDGVSTVWSYSRREGVEERLRAIRDQMVVLGGMAAVEGVPNQLRFDCGELHPRTLRFLIAQAVGKAPDYAPPGGAMSIRDSKSALTIHVEDAGDPERNVYRVSLEGESNNAALRLRMVLAGFVRYGEMEQVGDSGDGILLRSETRRLDSHPAALLPQHFQRRDHDGRRSYARADDHQHPGVQPSVEC